MHAASDGPVSIRVVRIIRGWARPGVDLGFLVRGNDMEGLKSAERGGVE